MEESLQKVLGRDDYIRETASSKLKVEFMLWALRQPMFEGCETEADCNETLKTAKAGPPYRPDIHFSAGRSWTERETKAIFFLVLRLWLEFVRKFHCINAWFNGFDIFCF